ncbi:MAG TPA: protein translocase subunit SecF [Pseudonocardiaceae bacterium]|jgi:preprotein translocase subunit SecF|nr:protein translocase subunit SecF [Pseudonocardiaceae bacterium]
MAAVEEQAPRPPRQGVFQRLYTGTGAFDIVGKRKRFYVMFGVVLVICLVSIIVRGFTFSIEFEGGTQIQMPANGAHGVISTQQATNAYADALGRQPSSVQSVGSGAAASIQIRSEALNDSQVSKLETTLFNELQPLDSAGKPSQSAISDSAVSGSWGSQISRQAIIGLVVFLVLVSIFLSIYFERRAALAALIALINDMLITAGVYSIVGFEVSPATVIGLLTILGFSLYDAVVVFDKVKENTRGILGLTRRTYGEEANLALNQTLMRSINTSLIALLPVLGLLVVGVGLLGVGTLTDLALVQLVGMLAGASSSLLLATPLLVDFTMRRKDYQTQARRVMQRRQTLAARQAAAEQAGEAVADGTPQDDVSDEVRKEAAYATASPTASGVPARTPKQSQLRAAQHRNRSGGKQGRPSGKRKR